MILELLALASLLRVDPTGDAHGAGDLVPPSAALYADRGPFDLVEVEVGGEEVLTVRVTLAGIPDPGGLPNGLTLPVLDVYLDLEEGGATLALPGVGMAMADRHAWEVAIRVHGDDAFLRLADDPDGATRPVDVTKDGNELLLTTTLPVPATIRDVQVVTGVYDPFSRDAWRPLSVRPSPWAFASETAAPPVVDLLAPNDAAQREAIRSYVLPSSQREAGPVGWLLLMFGGLGVATAGLWLRRRAPSRPTPVREPTESDRDETVPGSGGPPGDEAGRAVVPVGRAGRVASTRSGSSVPIRDADEPASPATDDDDASTPAARASWSSDGWADDGGSTDEHHLMLDASEVEAASAWVGRPQGDPDPADPTDPTDRSAREDRDDADDPDDPADRADDASEPDARDAAADAAADDAADGAAASVPRYRIKDRSARRRTEPATDPDAASTDPDASPTDPDDDAGR